MQTDFTAEPLRKPNAKKFLNFYLLYLNFFNEFLLEYSCFVVLLVSAIQQRESAARLHVAPLVWISFPFRSSRNAEFPELCSRLSLVIYTVDSTYKRDISASLSQFIPPPSAGCPYICSLCLYFCFANKIIRTIFSRFHIHALIYFLI